MPKSRRHYSVDPSHVNSYEYIPEKGLIVAVLRRAVLDLFYKSTRMDATHWFTDRSSYLKDKMYIGGIGYQDCIDWLQLGIREIHIIDRIIEAARNKFINEATQNGECNTEREKGGERSSPAIEQALTWVQRKAYATILREGRD